MNQTALKTLVDEPAPPAGSRAHPGDHRQGRADAGHADLRAEARALGARRDAEQRLHAARPGRGEGLPRDSEDTTNRKQP